MAESNNLSLLCLFLDSSDLRLMIACSSFMIITMRSSKLDIVFYLDGFGERFFVSPHFCFCLFFLQLVSYTESCFPASLTVSTGKKIVMLSSSIRSFLKCCFVKTTNVLMRLSKKLCFSIALKYIPSLDVLKVKYSFSPMRLILFLIATIFK